jgi:ribosomal protein S30
MGKLHGSLTRAGRVKDMTPKVCVCVEKTGKAGRAVKRAKYNRRMALDGEQPNKQPVQ